MVSVHEFGGADDSEEEVGFEPQPEGYYIEKLDTYSSIELKEKTKSIEETDTVQVLFLNIDYGKTMDEFRKYLENDKKIKVEDIKYKKYGKDSHRGEAVITIKGKKLVEEALKLQGTVNFICSRGISLIL